MSPNISEIYNETDHNTISYLEALCAFSWKMAHAHIRHSERHIENYDFCQLLCFLLARATTGILKYVLVVQRCRTIQNCTLPAENP